MTYQPRLGWIDLAAGKSRRQIRRRQIICAEEKSSMWGFLGKSPMILIQAKT
jgi:hypothetical protein